VDWVIVDLKGIQREAVGCVILDLKVIHGRLWTGLFWHGIETNDAPL